MERRDEGMSLARIGEINGGPPEVHQRLSHTLLTHRRSRHRSQSVVLRLSRDSTLS